MVARGQKDTGVGTKGSVDKVDFEEGLGGRILQQQQGRMGRAKGFLNRPKRWRMFYGTLRLV